MFYSKQNPSRFEKGRAERAVPGIQSTYNRPYTILVLPAKSTEKIASPDAIYPESGEYGREIVLPSTYNIIMENTPVVRPPDLLAPAGSLKTVDSALSAGADAVYVGCRGWSRDRQRAALAPGEIREAAALCREKGAMLHAALNTVPGATEVPGFLATVTRLAEYGVFAVILSDPGVISLVRREHPSLRITASVGVSTLNPPEARFYRDMGADAIVLPTALTPQEIPAIKAESGIRVEVFVRCRPEILLQGKCALPGYLREGALVPGRPHLAGTGTASSAKRTGRCQLVCRSIPLSRDAHSIEGDLASWIGAGVDAFKVQGRDLSPARLFDLVSRIRGKLDAAIAAVTGGNPA